MENYIVLTHNYLSQALVFPPQWGTSIQWYMTITTECMKLKLNECLSLQTSLQMMFYVTSDIFMLWKTKFFVWLWLKITSNFKGQYEGLPQNDPACDVMVVCSEYAVYQVKLFFTTAEGGHGNRLWEVHHEQTSNFWGPFEYRNLWIQRRGELCTSVCLHCINLFCITFIVFVLVCRPLLV